MKDKNKGNSDQIGGRKELGVEEGETIIRIYYVRKNSVSNKRKKCYNEFFLVMEQVFIESGSTGKVIRGDNNMGILLQ